MTPLQNSFELGSLPWHKQLALHEYRHIQQFNNFRKGISGLFYVLAGELGVSFANNTALPNWFWEGDAVFQETYVSEQGRGRLPFFFNGYRSVWAAKKNYSWMKLRNGSLRDYVPNHYQLGYLLTAYGREKYGNDIWGKVTDDAVRFRGLFYPMQKAVKKYTGIKYKQFRNDAFGFYKKEIEDGKDSISNWAAKEKHFAGDEEFPQWIDDKHLVLVNSSYKKIPRFIIKNIETGYEEKLRVRDISLDNYFSYRNHLIVYAAYDVDPRWGWRDYSEIRLLDVRSGQQRSVTQKTKYFAPDISEDGSQIIAVQSLPDGSCALHLIDANSGAVSKAIPNPDSLFYTYPKFYGKQQVVAAIRNTKGEMGLGIVNPDNGSIEWLVPFSMNVIGFPNVQGDTISFTASSGEQDRLFALINKKLYRIQPALTNEATGSYQLNIQGNRMAWVNFTSAGYRYTTQEANAGSFEEIDKAALNSPLPDYGISSLQKPGDLLNQLPATQYPVKKYSKAFRLINFHSWLPTISEPDYQISFISENVLNTMQSEVYFNYNTNENSKKFGFVTAYGATYPWFRLGGAFTKDRSSTYNGNPVIWNEWEARGGVLVPLNLTEGRTYNSLSIGTDYVYVKPEFNDVYKDTFDSRGYGYINSYLTFSSQIQQARQHIYPRLAQTLRLEYSKAVTNIEGNQFLANGWLYFPGLSVNHNLVVNTAWQGHDTLKDVSFTNHFPFSRGYSERNFHQMYKVGVNYHLPLFYPDWGFGSIVYFLRVRANAYYDYTHAMDYDNTKQRIYREYRSYGAEIFLDTKWWNQQPISFGFRYSRLVDGEQQGLGPNQYEFILPVNLISW
jgi:hypothetical protein